MIIQIILIYLDTIIKLMISSIWIFILMLIYIPGILNFELWISIISFKWKINKNYTNTISKKFKTLQIA